MKVRVSAVPYVHIWGEAEVPDNLNTDIEIRNYLEEHWSDISFDYAGADYDYAGTDFNVYKTTRENS